MTSIDAMADEIMKGLTEYADLADTSMKKAVRKTAKSVNCLLYTSPSPRDAHESRMPSSA